MDLISLAILAACCVLFLHAVVLRFIKFVIYVWHTDKIPGPAPFPGTSVLRGVMKLSLAERTNWLLSEDRKYTEGIWKTWVGPVAFIRLRKPEYVEKLLSSTVNITKSHNYEYLRPWLGQGLLSASGENWSRDRRMLTPAFHFNILEKYAVVMHERSEKFIKYLEETVKNEPNEPIDVFPRFLNYTLDVICETAMGIDPATQADKVARYIKCVHTFSKCFVERTHMPYASIDAIYFATKSGKAMKEAVHYMHQFTDDVIRKKKLARLQMNRNENSTKEEPENNNAYTTRKRKAFLDILLDANEKSDHPLSDVSLREQVDTFLFAGHDTTAAALSWALYAMACNPAIQERAAEELKAVLPDITARPTSAQLAELKYIERVIKETLRLYPSAPEVSRCLDTDITVGEYFIPKGSHVSACPIFTHRDPGHWPDPLKFDPDRFLPENSKDRHPYAYIPFSAGPRNCIGQKFAQLEAKIGLAAVLRRFEVKLKGKPEDTQLCSSVILRPVDGIYIRFVPRK